MNAKFANVRLGLQFKNMSLKPDEKKRLLETSIKRMQKELEEKPDYLMLLRKCELQNQLLEVNLEQN